MNNNRLKDLLKHYAWHLRQTCWFLRKVLMISESLIHKLISNLVKLCLEIYSTESEQE